MRSDKRLASHTKVVFRQLIFYSKAGKNALFNLLKLSRKIHQKMYFVRIYRPFIDVPRQNGYNVSGFFEENGGGPE